MNLKSPCYIRMCHLSFFDTTSFFKKKVFMTKNFPERMCTICVQLFQLLKCSDVLQKVSACCVHLRVQCVYNWCGSCYISVFTLSTLFYYCRELLHTYVACSNLHKRRRRLQGSFVQVTHVVSEGKVVHRLCRITVREVPVAATVWTHYTVAVLVVGQRG